MNTAPSPPRTRRRASLAPILLLAGLCAVAPLGGCALFSEPTIQSPISGKPVTPGQFKAEHEARSAELQARRAALMREFQAKVARVQGESALALDDLKAEYEIQIEAVSTMIETAKMQAQAAAEEFELAMQKREAAIGIIPGAIDFAGKTIPGAGPIALAVGGAWTLLSSVATGWLLKRNSTLKAHATNLIDAKDAADAATPKGDHDEHYEKVFKDFLTSRTAEFASTISGRKI